MSKTITVTQEQLDGVLSDCQNAADAAYGDSNDSEIELLRDALEGALHLLGLQMPDGHDPDEEEDEE